MKNARLLAVAAAVLISSGVGARAQAPTYLYNFLSGVSAAAGPYVATDRIPVKRTGVSGILYIPGDSYVQKNGDAFTPSAINLLNGTGLPIGGTTGNLPFNRLGVTGTPTGSKFVRDDGVLAVPSGSGASAGAAGDIQTSLDGAGAFGSLTPGGGIATWLATPSSANLLTALTTKTGTGLAVFGTSPSLTTPNLGTPSAATLTNATGLPVSSGISGFGTGIATWLATPSSANLAAALTDETGTGAAVFANSPTLITPNLGTPSAAVLTSATGLPISTGVSGLGTGVATLLATPSSANLLAALTTKTGTGNAVFGTAPTMTGVTLGDITGSTQCLHVSTLGAVTGTGSDCGAGGSWNLTDTVTPLSGVTALTVDHTAFTVGGTAGAATLGPLCPAAATTLGDASGAISVGKIARISATLTAARSYSMPAIASYPVGCQITIIDANRTVSGTNTATITRNADNATLNLGTTFPAISTGGFFTTWESDGTNWSLVGTGTVPSLLAGQIYIGNASNLTTASAPTGDVIPNSSNAWTIQAGVVTNAKAATMAAHSYKGNNTGSTGAPLDLTPTQLTAELNPLVGDSGAGGTKGLAPAPASGDAAAGKFLKADGTYAVPAGSGGNVNNSGTPTVGQWGVWVDATHIQGVAAPTAYMGFTFAPTASTTKFAAPFGSLSLTTEFFTVMPRAGTIKSIGVSDSVDIGNANTITFTVRVNQVDSSLVCVLTGTGSGFNVNTCTGTVTYAANDRISIKVVNTAITGTGQVMGNLEYLPS